MAETGARDWDRALGEMPGRWTETAGELRQFADLAGREGATRVYDVGCGAGRHTAYLAARGFEVTASDVSPSAMEHTRRTLAGAGLSARLLRSDIRRSPLAAASFHAVVAFNVVYHATRAEVQAVLDALAAILAPGGLLLITFKSTTGRGLRSRPGTRSHDLGAGLRGRGRHPPLLRRRGRGAAPDGALRDRLPRPETGVPAGAGGGPPSRALGRGGARGTGARPATTCMMVDKQRLCHHCFFYRRSCRLDGRVARPEVHAAGPAVHSDPGSDSD
ncbi:MAG: class I SAM-dependent methyltransferase [Gammaproteobacteria bacterium]|nr:class I SAM-dependent methyltransferase [Gammaproteobacteria bacterium]